jgi:phosphohistidine phosphatase
MSKYIILVRHAHSVDASPRQRDHERSLSAHGEQEAKLLGAYLRTHKLMPDAIFCSSATRTCATATIIEQEARFSSALRHTLSTLYLADAQQLHHHLLDLPDSMQCVMVIAHNSGISDWACMLANPREKEQIPCPLPTAGMLHFVASATSWEDIGQHACRLMHVFDPSLS